MIYKSGRFVIKIVTAFFIFTMFWGFFNTNVYAAALIVNSGNYVVGGTSTDTSSNTIQNPQQSEEEKFRDDSRSWFGKIGDAISEIVNSIKKIFTKGLSFIIDITIGNILQGAYNMVSAGMAKWIFLTPKLINFTWIKKLWWICYIMGAIGLVFGMLITGWSIITGKKRRFEEKGKEFNPSGLLTTLIIAFIGISLSLFIADFIINMENKMINSFATNTIYEQYEKYKGSLVSIGIDGNIKKEEIGFDSFSGDTLCRMAYGFDVNPSKSITANFIESSGFSALLPMMLAMNVLIVIGVFGLLRFFVIGILGGASPFWFSYCSFTGDTDPAWGWSNLFARSVALSFIFDLAWIFAVYVNMNVTENFFGSGQLIASMLFLIALVVAVKFWFKWVIKAVMSPLKLAGAEARMQWGKASQSVGKAMQKVGARYGMNELGYAGGVMLATGEVQQKIAQEKKEGNYDWEKGSVKDRLLDARLKYEKDYVRQYGTAGLITPDGSGMVETEGTLMQLNTAGVDSNRLYSILKDKNFEGVTFKTEDGRVMIDTDYMDKAKDIIQNSFQKDNIQDNSILDGEIGFKLKSIDGNKISEIEKMMQDKNIAYKNIYSITPNKEHVGQLMNEIHPENFADHAKYEQYNNLLKKFSADENGNYSCKLSDENAYRQVIDMFNGLAVDYKTDRDVWVDNNYKDTFMDNLVSVNTDKSIEIEDNREYVYFKVNFTNQNDTDGIKKLIDETYPGAAIIMGKGYIAVEKDDSEGRENKTEKINKLIQDYFKRVPYWEDNKGRYWYKDNSVKRVVPHMTKPDKGRLMGKR